MKPTNEKLAADILSAGKKEFLEKGFQGASMRSIASSLAVTTGAIYRYYTDKEADRKSTRLNSSHSGQSRMPSSA